MKQNTDSPSMSYEKAVCSVEIVADSLESAKNYQEKDKCLAAEHWLRESLFTLSEFKMDIDEKYGNIVSMNSASEGQVKI